MTATMHDSNMFRPQPQLGLPLLALLLLALCLLLGLSRLSLAAPEPSANPSVVGHQISIRLDPSAGTLSATDRLTLPPNIIEQPTTETSPTADYLIQLHQGLTPKVLSDNARLKQVARLGHLAQYRLTAPPGAEVALQYQGRIQQGLDAVREGMGRERQQSLGTIGLEGVFLSGYSGWYPKVLGSLETLSLEVSLPQDWLAVAQGVGPKITTAGQEVRVGWQESAPQDELYLIAAPFKLYREPTEVAEAQAFLRSADDALAARYLEATATYLKRYSQLIGDYPYAKFALVENFWETGYGMPSFTLLGPRVLRLPFILHSSYPHEILHNWWGNGVYIDYAQGNWSEGLTAYLADHLNQELAGKGADYRRDQLKAYADYVRDNQDQPLSQFQGRHGTASQAIGYGKALMLFHMLRTQLGDPLFVQGLQRFYRDNRFTEAGWAQIEAAFAAESKQDLSDFFRAWTSRTGAPSLALEAVALEPLDAGRWRLSGRLEQTQTTAPFPMSVPLALLDEQGKATEILVQMQERHAPFAVELDARPARIAVDPRFDTFRRLAEGESTATLSSLFGAERGLILIPSAAPTDLRNAYQRLAEAWQRGQPGWSIALDRDLEQLPGEQAIWLLGWRNRWLPALAAIGRESGQFKLDPAQQRLRLLGTEHQGQSLVISADTGTQAIGWVAASKAAAVNGLARKLPHYGKYGYLVFVGAEPTNLAKGQWPAGESSLTRWLGEARPALQYSPRRLLIDDPSAPSVQVTDHGQQRQAATPKAMP